MTFYWWSHWFWITLLAVILLPPYASVHTYPSQEISSLEYNQNSRNIKTAVTKLYQQATSSESSIAIDDTSTTTTTTNSINSSSSTLPAILTPASASASASTPMSTSQPAINTADNAAVTVTDAVVGMAGDEEGTLAALEQKGKDQNVLHADAGDNVNADDEGEGEGEDEDETDDDNDGNDDDGGDGDGDGDVGISGEKEKSVERTSLMGMEAFEETDGVERDDVSAGEDADAEYKRSVENYSNSNNNNRTTENIEMARVAPLSIAANATAQLVVALSNYTNFSTSSGNGNSNNNNSNNNNYNAASSLNATQGNNGNNSSKNNNNNNTLINNINSNSSNNNSNNNNNIDNNTNNNDVASIRGSTAAPQPAASPSPSMTTTKPIANVGDVDGAAPPSAPKIDTAAGSAEWINAELASASAAAAASPTIIDHSAINVTMNTTNSNSHNNNNNNNSTITNADSDNANNNNSDSIDDRVPFTLENANKEDELRRAENEHRTRKSKTLSADYKHINRFINYSTDSKNLLARSASTASNTAAEYEPEESNISSEALSVQRTYFLDAGAISAICFTVFGVCCAVGTVGIVLYRRRYMNKPQALSEPDSSVYIDDSTMRVSDNSDEMYSLDNDSFLNSLEAMTIQNYWTDTVKHTKL